MSQPTKRKNAKLHKGKMQDCPRCRVVELGLDECFRQIAPQKKKPSHDNTYNQPVAGE